jgi:AhpD family alkylhydroperoxidase
MTEIASHYHDPSDRKYDRYTRQNAPAAHGAFVAMNQAVFGEESVLPLKYRELMALSVALITQCEWCIEAHSGNARKQGATKEEIAETIMLAGTMRASASVAHGRMVWKFFLDEQA